MPKTGGIYLQNKDWTLIGSLSITSSAAYTFTITSASTVQGDVYSNNGQQFTVTTATGTITSMACGGTGAPAASGTLTRVSGTGPSTLTFSSVASSIPVFGTGGINNLYMRRNGGNAEFRFEYVHSVAGTNGSGQYMFYANQGIFPYLIDNTKVSNQVVFVASGSSFPRSAVGSFTAEMNTSTSVLAGSVSVFGNYITMAGSAGSSAAGSPSVIGSNYIGLAQGATMSICAEWSVPIATWSFYD
jgi:hypothetical protein